MKKLLLIALLLVACIGCEHNESLDSPNYLRVECDRTVYELRTTASSYVVSNAFFYKEITEAMDDTVMVIKTTERGIVWVTVEPDGETIAITEPYDTLKFRVR